MFEREHHRRVASVLQALDARLLHAHQCLFGGGTALALVLLALAINLPGLTDTGWL